MNFFTSKLKTSLLPIMLLSVGLFSACAKEEGGKRATAFDIFGITEKNPDANTKEIVFTDDFVWERNTAQIFDAENETVGSDGSQITTLKDAFGNITQQRNFRNNPRLKTIVIISGTDGKQVIYLYGQSGKVAQITDETKKNFLDMSADDLADLGSLQQPIAGNSFDEPKISSSLPVKDVGIPNQPQPDFSKDYKNNFPPVNENNSQLPEQSKTENPQNDKPNPPETSDNNQEK